MKTKNLAINQMNAKRERINYRMKRGERVEEMSVIKDLTSFIEQESEGTKTAGFVNGRFTEMDLVEIN